MLRLRYKIVAREAALEDGTRSSIGSALRPLVPQFARKCAFFSVGRHPAKEKALFSNTMPDAFPKRRTEDPLHQGKRRGSAVRAFANGIIRRRRRRPTGKNLHRTRFSQTSATRAAQRRARSRNGRRIRTPDPRLPGRLGLFQHKLAEALRHMEVGRVAVGRTP